LLAFALGLTSVTDVGALEDSIPCVWRTADSAWPLIRPADNLAARVLLVALREKRHGKELLECVEESTGLQFAPERRRNRSRRLPNFP
jgi:hypothetical protein